LLVGAVEGDCAAAVGALKQGACTLALDGGQYGSGADAAGALQGTLAAFLRRCPGGAVLVERAGALSMGALRALHSALSEGGGFRDGGAHISAGDAAFVLAFAGGADLAAAAAAAGGDAATFDSAAKAAFLSALAPHADGGEHDAAAAAATLLTAFRRRIDFVLPLRATAEVPAAQVAAVPELAEVGAAAVAAAAAEAGAAP
jgi:hypothetical protein